MDRRRSGALLGELRRRRRDLIGARAAVAQALDRLEVCTDDVMRIARVSAAGVRVEADIAQRARDLRERAQERDAIARARIHEQRLRARRPGRRAGRARLTEPSVRPSWPGPAAATTPSCGRRRRRSGTRSIALTRPQSPPVNQVEALVEAGDRAAATEPARATLERARKLGSRWLVDELTALAERARLDLADGHGEAVKGNGDGAPGDHDEDPFGLTNRERQVLALIAEGATNRQIGAALFMAEKTASVHVSRILRKLGVSSRTQAAAVAHRLHLSG